MLSQALSSSFEKSLRQNRIRPETLHFRFETRFYICLLLSIATFVVASSIGSGWALFLSAGAFSAALLSFLLPLFILSSISLEICGPERLESGEEISLILRPCCSFWKLPWMRHFVVQVQVENNLLFQKNSRVEAIYLKDLKTEEAMIIKCPGLKRGIGPLPAVALETSFPFGMVWCKGVFRNQASKLVVLPKIEELEGAFLKRLRSGSFVPGDMQSTSTGFQSCYAKGIRDYNRSDSRRHIHWALSARHGHLVVREFENEGVPAFDVALDSAAVWKNSEQYELAITVAASLLDLGHSLGIHPELFILTKPLAPGESLPGRCVEVDEQLLALAALEYKAATKSKAANSRTSSDPLAFGSGQKALVLVSIQEESLSVDLESVPSRNTILVLRISEVDGMSFQPSANNELVVASAEELSCL